MKSRKLTASEVSITLSEADIKTIPFNRTHDLPADEAALEAIGSGLEMRGRGMNIFVCGPSSAERTMITTTAAQKAAASAPKAPDLVLCASAGGGSEPVLLKLPSGTADKLSSDLENESEDDFVREWSPVIGPEITGLLKNLGSKDLNILVSNRNSAMPVIFENNPVPRRLFGRNSDKLSGVKAGSLIKSGGGILMLNADDLIVEEDSWHRLKRALRSGCSEIGGGQGDREEWKGLLLPEIEQDFKVVILGSEQHYDHFYNTDEDFRELFQFFAEFDSVIELTPETLSLSVNHFRTHAIDQHNRILTDSGALEVVKYSISTAENKTKMSTSLYDLDIIITEAAVAEETIDGRLIRDTIQRQANRFGLLEKRILEDMASGEINLKVEGSEIGKVNGLAIIDKGPYSFGFPGLISARIAPGESGLVNIEHEAGLSGEIHDKWVLILEGFLRSRFALEFPISIFASLCFEQSYSEIDGDSASSSELYALLSAISGIPIRQDIAVTGSLSQTGEIQAVGGLREKIEGFYKTCKALTYTGSQGVIVPEKNIKNIILPDEIVDEVEAGRFHIYPVSTVNDSMEILTGMEAGSRNSRGVFPHGTFNQQVEKSLKKLAQQAKSSGS
ncbi:MAG: AAA family ATPase [Spirochaetales bacterium]|nr:AAA family ATPase [Spirochaetales bacterium]